MYNATFLAQQNKLLRAANAKQTTKRAKSAQQLAYQDGYIAGQANQLISVEKKAGKKANGAAGGAARNNAIATSSGAPAMHRFFRNWA